ncbi:MAG: response regulator [Oligoflexia bacterium]|nr:response regulator [Oligoflexia bacterium]
MTMVVVTESHGPKSDPCSHDAPLDGQKLVDQLQARVAVLEASNQSLAVEVASHQENEARLRLREEEQAQLQAQLVEAQKMEALGVLAGGVAHDFNNQLMIISSYAEFLSEALSSDDPLRREVETIQAAAKRSASITRQLLAFSRRQVVLPRRVDPIETLVNLERMLRRMLGANIQLELRQPQPQVQGPPPKVFVDPGQFEQVLINLAVNAKDAMPDGGRLVFDVDLDRVVESGPDQPGGHHVAIEVMDTGQGMDRATLSRIFEPFFTTKGEGRGTGLGLATAYGVIHQAKGRIHVDSKPGHGTCFTILLPWATPDMKDYADAPVADRTTLDGTETLLVVDDEPGIREIARRTLSRQGYTVLTAANAGEALLHAERYAGPIDLVLTDIIMPLMNGLELVRRLKHHRPAAQVILMTGFADHDLLRQALPQQPYPLMRKPFSPSELAAHVRATLDAEQHA